VILISTPITGRAQANLPIAGNEGDSFLDANPFVPTGISVTTDPMLEYAMEVCCDDE
jgi:hypothetical protein